MYYIIMKTITEDEITLEQKNKGVENINVECKNIYCHPVINALSNIYKLICHFLKCFKLKKRLILWYIYLYDKVLSLSCIQWKKQILYDTKSGKKVYFGASGYSDFTKHKDEERKQR